MAHTFTPPYHYKNGPNLFVPEIDMSKDPDGQSPMKFFNPHVPIGINVWLWTDNSIQESQPPLAEARLNKDGTITPGIKKLWGGGRTHQISDSEYVVLLAAGYGANLT